MHKKWKEMIVRIGSVLFFGGYFYVLFVNLANSFLISVSSKKDVILALFAAAAVAILLPGIICWQHCYIRKLEEMIDKME